MPELFAVEFVVASRPRRNEGLYKDSQIYDRVRLRFKNYRKLVIEYLIRDLTLIQLMSLLV